MRAGCAEMGFPAIAPASELAPEAAAAALLDCPLPPLLETVDPATLAT